MGIYLQNISMKMHNDFWDDEHGDGDDKREICFEIYWEHIYLRPTYGSETK